MPSLHIEDFKVKIRKVFQIIGHMQYGGLLNRQIIIFFFHLRLRLDTPHLNIYTLFQAQVGKRRMTNYTSVSSRRSIYLRLLNKRIDFKLNTIKVVNIRLN